MNELPHFFGLDFSAAGPWVLVGFLAGSFLSWLWRALRGSRLEAKTQAKVQEIEALLDASRSEHQSEVARLLSDARNFEQALADAERRAAANAANVSRLAADLDRQTKAELTSRNELLAIDGQMAKLKSSLQWAENQARNALQEQQNLQQQLNSLLTERQTLTADLATVKTAAELKDAEIARLINQVQWHENRAASLEQEKVGLTSHLSVLGSKDDEIGRLTAALLAAQGDVARLTGDVTAAQADLARTLGELGSMQTAFASLQSSATGGTDALGQAQSKYEQAWKDLTYMRNLAYWQASEIDRLRKAITVFETDVASKSATLITLTQEYDALKSKLAGLSRVSAGGRGRLAGRGSAKDAPRSGKFAFLHRHGKAAPKSVRKAYKLKARLGMGGAAAGPTGGKRFNGYGHPLMVLGKSAQAHQPNEDIARLKAQLAALSEDASRYRRLKDAVHQASRIADEQL